MPSLLLQAAKVTLNHTQNPVAWHLASGVAKTVHQRIQILLQIALAFKSLGAMTVYHRHM